MKKAAFTSLCLLTSILAFGGGGWTQGKGNSFVLLSQRYIGGGFYAFSPRKILDFRPGRAGYYSTHFYGEYGLGQKLDLVLHSPVLSGYFYKENGMSESQNALGLGDVDLAVKYQLMSGSLNLAGSLMMGIPTGNSSAGDQNNILLGDGEFNQMAKLDLSSGFGKGYFATASLGFNNRTNGYSDEIHAAFEIGVTRNKLIAILKLYLLKSTFNGTRAEASLPGIYSNNLEYLAVSPVFIYKMGNKGLLLDLGFAPYLRNILAVPSFTFGMYWELKKKKKD